MIQILAGAKGEGKTKRLIEMANAAGKVANGHVVFVDDDNQNMYDLHYDIRLVSTSDFLMEDLEVLYGFICGILSQDRDIEKIYIDGIQRIVGEISSEKLEDFTNKLEKTSADYNVDFIMIISKQAEELPEKLREFMI